MAYLRRENELSAAVERNIARFRRRANRTAENAPQWRPRKSVLTHKLTRPPSPTKAAPCSGAFAPHIERRRPRPRQGTCHVPRLRRDRNEGSARGGREEVGASTSSPIQQYKCRLITANLALPVTAPPARTGTTKRKLTPAGGVLAHERLQHCGHLLLLAAGELGGGLEKQP